jgi:hypothetical protein
MSIEFKVKAEREGNYWNATIKELDLSDSHDDLTQLLTNLSERAILKLQEEFKSQNRIEVSISDVKATAVLGVRAYDDHALSDFVEASEEPGAQAMLPEGDDAPEETWISSDLQDDEEL